MSLPPRRQIVLLDFWNNHYFCGYKQMFRQILTKSVVFIKKLMLDKGSSIPSERVKGNVSYLLNIFSKT